MTRAISSLFALCLLLMPAAVQAQTPSDQPTTIVCGSKTGERRVCAANTTGGVTLVKTLGTATCELGRTWGYDAIGVSVLPRRVAFGLVRCHEWLGRRRIERPTDRRRLR
jgi:hypothetical protein